MYKSLNKVLISAVGIAAFFATQAQATPAFARQMSMDCMSCHYQNIPKLNSFGRSFKLSGFTMTSGDDDKIIASKESGGLSIPTALNFGFVTKARYIDSGTITSKTEIFDEAAIIFGGRISEFIGTSMEFTEGLVGGKITVSTDAVGDRIGLSYYMTDALGAFASTEIYSTGLYRPVRQFENRKGANIFQKIGIGSGAATGMNFYYSDNGLYATVGLYVPAFGNSITTGGSYKTMARAAYEMTIAGHEFSIGTFYLGGDISSAGTDINSSATITDLDKFDDTSYGFDIQTQGSISNLPLMITLGYVLSNTDISNTTDNEGFSLGAQLSLTDTFGVKVAFLSYTDNIVTNGDNDETDITGGLEYNAAQNVRLVLEYTSTNTNAGTTDQFLAMAMMAF